MRRSWLALLTVPLLTLTGHGCGDEKAVKIGAVLPLSGSQELYGQSVRRGLELAQDVLAESDAPPVEVVYVDSGSDPGIAAEKATELYREGVWAVIGGVTTAETMEMVPVADQFDRVLISPSASSPELTGISTNFYRIFPSDFLEGTKMGNFAAQTLQLETALILAAAGPYAVGVQQVFQAEFERNGGNVLEIIEFPENTSDFSGLLDRVMTLDPDCVYLAAFGIEVARMIEGLREREYEGTILTTHAFATSSAIAAAGEGATGVFLTQTAFELQGEDPEIRQFAQAYRAEYDEAPDIYAAHGYDALMILMEGLAANEVVTPGDLWQGLRGIRNYAGVTGALQFDERGDVQKFPRVYVINAEGELLNYEAEVERRRRELLERLRKLDEERRRTALQGGGNG